jgi:hypothetical protein
MELSEFRRESRAAAGQAAYKPLQSRSLKAKRLVQIVALPPASGMKAGDRFESAPGEWFSPFGGVQAVGYFCPDREPDEAPAPDFV